MDNQKDRRVTTRHPASFEVTYVHQGDYLISQSKDISIDGMFLRTTQPAKAGDRISLAFFPAKGNQIKTEAEVVWVNDSEQSPDQGMAVKFYEPSQEFSEKIMDMIRKVAVLEQG